MKKVAISEHAFDWENTFIKEAQIIKNRLKNLSFFIDHVGSTSVPGLPAKPIIDILISVQDWSLSGKIAEYLQDLGYQLRETCLDTPRFYLVKYPPTESIGYHVHICGPDSKWAQDMLNFKEELSTNEKISESYAVLKKNLAQTHHNDIEAYAIGKKDFIEEALKNRVCKFSVNRLLTHQRIELDKADHLRKWMMRIQLLVAIGAAISVYPNGGGVLLVIALLGFTLLGIWLFLNQSQQKHRAAGDQARRAVLFMSGLNRQPSLEEQQRILKKFLLPISDAPLSLEESRFASREFPSYKRLAELIEESAFWTGDLYHASAGRMSILLWTSLLIGFAVSVIAIIYAPQDDLISLNRALIAVMVFFVSSDVLGLFFSYKQSAISLDDIFHRVEIASLRGYLEADILLLASDYNAVIDNAPSPLPSLILSRSKKLGQRWSVYKEMKRTDSESKV
ncbi:dephospho-CoA kinase/protein folding accessory domain-containing protein [Pseudomonas sp. 31 E 6]|uniref:GrpB family protein n=1 Tax=unclassified Pseudomonas TaxID=196821 RepID=UPI000812BE88|nr:MULTISPECIES: GrpB family protein [unclassified Pseudomonas]CRM40209.1 dephospho-CoA kinase/protein folding accessory domain-containing protein [Pseudomonas sp. 31 E 5]CRM41636.1 dephospho-CoA kinase/protein folding accessory domain-containing protein [Pseudomonas sp. 52 E 6]CRM72906.1 dephospho-CoA kinase/protein folding accessory domain-containing protein [Pseudomonas sp. 31 E 6]